MNMQKKTSNSYFRLPVWFDAIGSTNTYLKEQVYCSGADSISGTVVVARKQLAGRGRKSRVWLSDKGENLTFSFVLDIPEGREDVSNLTLTAGVAVCEAIRDFGLQALIKWPNDLLVENKKICGILCETASQNGSIKAICGIGININMTDDVMDCIDKPATSLYEETQICYRPEDVLVGVLESLDYWLDIWLNTGFAGVRSRWIALAFGLGLGIDIVEDGDVVDCGFFAGIGDKGQLLLRKCSGQTVEIYTGDVVWPNR